MMDESNQSVPAVYWSLEQATKSAGFSMASDRQTGELLRVLAASKPASRCLELGTGTGLSTAWITAGLDASSTLLSLDNDAAFLQIARDHLGADNRLTLLHTDGEAWIKANRTQQFDYIFADTWPGKYSLLDDVLGMLAKGGLYIIDDMNWQPNWPEGHEVNVRHLLTLLEQRTDLMLTRLNWSTGIVIAVKV